MTHKPWHKRQDAPDAHRLRGRAGVQRRARWLSMHPLCVHCEAVGRVSAASVVDHFVPLSKGGADDDSNLQSLCKPCDEVKTAADLGHRVRHQIGADGWPVGEI